MQKLHYVIIFDTNSPLRPLLSKKKKKENDAIKNENE